MIGNPHPHQAKWVVPKVTMQMLKRAHQVINGHIRRCHVLINPATHVGANSGVPLVIHVLQRTDGRMAVAIALPDPVSSGMSNVPFQCHFPLPLSLEVWFKKDKAAVASSPSCSPAPFWSLLHLCSGNHSEMGSLGTLVTCLSALNQTARERGRGK